MSCWRVLNLFQQPNDRRIPQLLVKSVFDIESYTVYITDLSDVWAETLHLEAIVDRASSEQSPIEVSKHDTAQIAILLENIQKSLLGSEDAVCRITRRSVDGLTLHTNVILPEPLGSLTWTHQLDRRTSVTLKNELILPLLVSSHIQNERISNLIATIIDKDKAINRLLDQYDSGNLDLAAAFPTIGGLKTGRKAVKREQAAKHVPALQPFCEQPWRELTEQFEDSNVATLGLFRQALAQKTPRVPKKLISEECSETWWTAVSDTLVSLKPDAGGKKEKAKNVPTRKAVNETSEEETEDEFETHENYKKRDVPPHENETAKTSVTKLPTLKPVMEPITGIKEADVSTEDEEDLDVLPESHSRNQIQSQSREKQDYSPPAKSPVIKSRPSLPHPGADIESPAKPKTRGYQIGGKAKKVPFKSSSQSEDTGSGESEGIFLSKESIPPPVQCDSQTCTSPRKVRRQFKIGGKGKTSNEDTSQHESTDILERTRIRPILSPTTEPPSTLPPQDLLKEETPVQEHNEETPEEKAERKRAELKRKNAEAAKKQAQLVKKKRRF